MGPLGQGYQSPQVLGLKGRTQLLIRHLYSELLLLGTMTQGLGV